MFFTLFHLWHKIMLCQGLKELQKLKREKNREGALDKLDFVYGLLTIIENNMSTVFADFPCVGENLHFDCSLVFGHSVRFCINISY